MTVDLLFAELDRRGWSHNETPAVRRFLMDLALCGALTSTGSSRGTSDNQGQDLIRPVLPPDWKWTTLGDLSPEFQNGASSRGDSIGTSTIVLRLADIKNGRISVDDPRRIVLGDEARKKYDLLPGDILIIRVNGSSDLVGRFVLNDEDADMAYCDHFIRLRVDPSLVLPDYLRIVGDWTYVRSQITALFVTSAGQKTVNQRHLASLSFPLPSVPEQQRIVSKVDELMGLCDQLEATQREQESRRGRLRAWSMRDIVLNGESKQRVQFFLQYSPRMITKPEHVSGVRRAISELAVRGRLVPQEPDEEPANDLLKEIESHETGPGSSVRVHRASDVGGAYTPRQLPHGWVWTDISQTFKVTGGIQKQPKRLPRDNAVPYLGVSNVQRGRLDLRAVAQFELFAGELEKFRLEPGDLLIVEGNGSQTEIGRCARWNGEISDCVHQNHIIRCRPLKPGLEDFVLLYLNSEPGMTAMRELAITSAGLYSLSVGKIKQITLPLPPLAEQNRIVSKVNELMAVCDQLEQSLAAEQIERSRLLEALLRDALVARAV